MGRSPVQYFQVPFASEANLTPRRHREYSGPVVSGRRMGTPGRRGEVSGAIGVKTPQGDERRNVLVAQNGSEGKRQIDEC